MRPLCGCGRRRPYKGATECCDCRSKQRGHYRQWRVAPCARCGEPSIGNCCRKCSALLKQDERRTRVVNGLRAKGLTMKEIADLMGITRQRVEQIAHRNRNRARSAVRFALKTGRIEKPTFCERCEAITIDLEAHHSDYDRHLDITWLCVPCHNIVHPHPGRPRGLPRQAIPA
jgi:hypothetical protein